MDFLSFSIFFDVLERYDAPLDATGPYAGPIRLQRHPGTPGSRCTLFVHILFRFFSIKKKQNYMDSGTPTASRGPLPAPMTAARHLSSSSRFARAVHLGHAVMRTNSWISGGFWRIFMREELGRCVRNIYCSGDA